MDVIIIGAGGHGKVVLDILRAAGTHRAIGFLAAAPALAGTTISGLPVLGPIHHLSKLRQQSKIRGAIVAIGDNRARRTYAQHVIDDGIELANAVHPTASVSTTIQLGRNVVIAAGAIASAEARIADSVILN